MDHGPKPPPPRPRRLERKHDEPGQGGGEHGGEDPRLTGLPLNRAMEYSLVLWSMGISHRLVREREGYAILVGEAKSEQAREEIRLYLEENKAPGIEPELEGRTDPRVLLPILMIILFYPLTNLSFPGHRIFHTTWTAIGSAEAAAILDGQWWRLATALTLHADPGHLLGNAVIGSGFLLTASRFISPGLCALLTICAGILGNLLNAAVLGPPHNAIGFSTAVFGTAGLLVGHRAAGGARRSLRAIFLPLAAGLALLSMLGVGDERTDVSAHLFGFLAGLALGAIVKSRVRSSSLPPRAENVLLLLPLLILAGSWHLALSVRP
jgi:rhomboid protease GluP